MNFMQEKSQFQSPQSQELEMHSSAYEFSDSRSENSYIDQFLSESFYSGDLKISDSSVKSPSVSEFQARMEDRQEATTPKPIRSKFHNYQKHLIITLRNSADLSELIAESGLSEATLSVWNCFKKLRTYNKSLLRVLFGEEKFTAGVDRQLFVKQGFQNTLDSFEESDVLKAQRALKEVVIEFFQKSDLDSLVDERRLSPETKTRFKLYLKEFLFELQEGSVVRRLPKHRKKNIVTVN